MVDSGASVTTLSRNEAKAADVPITGRQTTVSTANGTTLAVQSMADMLEVGSIQRTDFPVDINEHDDVNLLGMNFLSSLRSWRVEGNYLVLEP
jgi:aspartyl protease family protein